jgi:hypothetical protein
MSHVSNLEDDIQPLFTVNYDEYLPGSIFVLPPGPYFARDILTMHHFQPMDTP